MKRNFETSAKIIGSLVLDARALVESVGLNLARNPKKKGPFRPSFHNWSGNWRMFTNFNSSGSEMASCIEVQSAVPNTQTSISDFYVGKTVFITGGTGFMGKVLLEKLLRACSGVSKIYLLIRSKKGQPARDRLQQMLCSPVSKSQVVFVLSLHWIEWF